MHWCLHHLRAAWWGLGRGIILVSVPPQQVIGVPQGGDGRFGGWSVNEGVVFDAPEVAHALNLPCYLNSFPNIFKSLYNLVHF